MAMQDAKLEDLVAAEALGDIASARADLARGGQAVNDYDPDEVGLENSVGCQSCCQVQGQCKDRLCFSPGGGACQPCAPAGRSM